MPNRSWTLRIAVILNAIVLVAFFAGCPARQETMVHVSPPGWRPTDFKKNPPADIVVPSISPPTFPPMEQK